MTILILEVKIVINDQRDDIGVVCDAISPKVGGNKGEG
jgi:hypothetical protein